MLEPGTASAHSAAIRSTVDITGRWLESPPRTRKPSLPARSSTRPIRRNAASETTPWFTICRIAPVTPLRLKTKIPITIRFIWLRLE